MRGGSSERRSLQSVPSRAAVAAAAVAVAAGVAAAVAASAAGSSGSFIVAVQFNISRRVSLCLCLCLSASQGIPKQRFLRRIARGRRGLPGGFPWAPFGGPSFGICLWSGISGAPISRGALGPPGGPPTGVRG